MRRTPSEREALERTIERRVAPIAAALGIVFVLVVVGEGLAAPGSGVQRAFVVTGWILWGLFVAEFGLRMAIAPSTTRFLKRNWWQVVFLVVPFLRFLQVLRLTRAARAGRIATSAVRGARGAASSFRSRLVWLASVQAIVVLATSQLLFEFGDIDSYGDALYQVTIASVSGEPLQADGGVARVLGVALAVYAVIVFATLAGVVGAYLVERRGEDRDAAEVRSVDPGAHGPRSDATAA